MTDDELCKALEGTGDVLYAFPVFCVRRRGALLLALPKDRIAARATLKLYHPQAWLARVVVKFLFCLIHLGLHIFLPCRIMCIRKDSPLSPMAQHAQEIGFLLGNPNAPSRRAIILHSSGQKYWVDKLGIGKLAKSSVMAEVAIIKKLPQNHKGLPIVKEVRVEDDWACYTTPYLQGKSAEKKDYLQIIALLRDWMNYATFQSFKTSKIWQEMVDYVESSDDAVTLKYWNQLSNASKLTIKMGLVHGDFAPWNIKVMEDGSIHVMDWEHAILSGPIGWDWLHYMIQMAILVDKLPASEVLEVCRDWARSAEGESFLKDAGWGEDVESWIGSYLMYSSWIMKFEREELLLECLREVNP